MFSCFDRYGTQKELYFKIKSVFDISECSLSGVYAIYSNNTCHYVGQSKNLPSRLATHLSGKYKKSDTIFIWNNYEEEDLIASEKWLIKRLEPTENLMVDFSEDIDINSIIDAFHNCEKDAFNITEDKRQTMTIINEKSKLFIADSEISENIYSNDNIRNLLSKEIENVNKFKDMEVK